MITPTLVVPIGPPASGKSTLAAKLLLEYPSLLVLSTDAIRLELCPSTPCMCRQARSGCMGGQECHCRQFEMILIWQRRICANLQAGSSVFADAMNLKARDRRSLLELTHPATTRSHAIMLPKLPLAELLARNAARTRHVPEEVIAKRLQAFGSLKPAQLRAEGFTSVTELGPDMEVLP